MGADDPAARTEELAAIALDTRLRDYDIPRDDLGELSAATAERGAAKANPRVATSTRSTSSSTRSGSVGAARPGPRRVRRKGRAHPGAVVVAPHPSFRPAPADHGRSGKEAAVSSLPSAPSLEQLRKQAKDLLRAHRAGDPERRRARAPRTTPASRSSSRRPARRRPRARLPELAAAEGLRRARRRPRPRPPARLPRGPRLLRGPRPRPAGVRARRHRERRRRVRAPRRAADRGGRAHRRRAPARLRQLGGPAPPRRGPARLGRALRPRLPRRRGP